MTLNEHRTWVVILDYHHRVLVIWSGEKNPFVECHIKLGKSWGRRSMNIAYSAWGFILWHPGNLIEYYHKGKLCEIWSPPSSFRKNFRILFLSKFNPQIKLWPGHQHISIRLKALKLWKVNRRMNLPQNCNKSAEPFSRKLQCNRFSPLQKSKSLQQSFVREVIHTFCGCSLSSTLSVLPLFPHFCHQVNG